MCKLTEILRFNKNISIFIHLFNGNLLTICSFRDIILYIEYIEVLFHPFLWVFYPKNTIYI